MADPKNPPPKRGGARRGAQAQQAQQAGMDERKHPPNPGIVELAAAIRLKQGISDAAKTYAAASETARKELARTLVDEIANDANFPKLYNFAGFLGGVLNQQDPTSNGIWQLLYLDPKLLTWLLVNEESVVLTKNVKDEKSPFGSYDYVWLESDASVSSGEGPLQKNEIQARFLRGDFVSAGDFAASVTGGTFTPPTGPSCPLTPGCCGIRTR